MMYIKFSFDDPKAGIDFTPGLNSDEITFFECMIAVVFSNSCRSNDKKKKSQISKY